MDKTACLIVGSGLMVPCLVSTLQSLGYQIIIAGNVESELSSLSSQFGVAQHIVDATVPAELEPLLVGISFVISMVPAKFHHFVLRACINRKVNLITPSYVSNDMNLLQEEAKNAGIVVLNEVGLDPGIDHMSVIKKLESIRALGGRLVEFQSSCGAFPAPEACTNLFSYKLAWAPYGALLAAVRPARYIHKGQLIEIPGELLMDSAKPYDLAFEKELTYYPNGDSSIYPEKYGIHDSETVVRCSLRYKNYPIICKALNTLGLYNESPQSFESELTWNQLLDRLAGEKEISEDALSSIVPIPHIENPVVKKILQKLAGFDAENLRLIISAFSELGMLSANLVKGRSVFDAFVNLVSVMLEYGPGERDCVVMEHIFLVEYPDKKIKYRSKLIDYGVPNGGTSAISRLVSVPAALAADWVFKNKHEPGFMYPMESQFCHDVLNKLEAEYNVYFAETEEIVN